MPSAVIWFDTETTQLQVDSKTIEHKLAFGWLCHMRQWRRGEWTRPKWVRFETAEQFYSAVDGLSQSGQRTYIFCHNAGFDIPCVKFFEVPQAHGWQLKSAIIGDPPTILTYRKENKTLKVVDTFNIWPVALGRIGKMVNCAKLPLPEASASTQAWDDYCRNDVEIIRLACLEWWEYLKENNLGGFAMTLAGQAFKTWRHRFMDAPVFCDCNVSALKLARAAYQGGRCECFYIGRVLQPVHRLDVNSMYPAVMRDEYYPCHISFYTRAPTLEKLRHWLRDCCVVAKVALSTQKALYPLKHNSRLVFPVGRFESCLCTPELIQALKQGHIVKVLEAAVYERGRPFVSYVDHFYRLKQEARSRGDMLNEYLNKILLNGFYGKFGQRGTHYQDLQSTQDMATRHGLFINLVTGQVSRQRQLGGLLQIESRETESRESHPAIAAHVTAYARMRLYRLICLAGAKNVLYCDTDSLDVNTKGLARLSHLVNPERLGGLKLECTAETAEYRGCKDYTLGTVARIKGIRANAVETAAGVFSQDRWTHLKGMVRANNLTTPKTARIVKRLERVYRKGIVLPDGRVAPLALDVMACDTGTRGDVETPGRG
jgi:hypothetical protein